jgi:hypothetical protein
MQAQEKLYRTTDGRLVKEGDPAAAELAYNPGDEVPEDEARRSGLMPEEGGQDQPQGGQPPQGGEQPQGEGRPA